MRPLPASPQDQTQTRRRLGGGGAIPGRSGGAGKEKDRRKEKLEKEESGSWGGRGPQEEEPRAADAPLGAFLLSSRYLCYLAFQNSFCSLLISIMYSFQRIKIFI